MTDSGWAIRRRRDLMIHDGLWCPFENWHMGNTGEVVAEKHQITRETQDDFAYNSHRKAHEAQQKGYFKDEIIPIEIPQKKGRPDRARLRRTGPPRHDRRSARQTEAGVQERRRDRDGGKCSGRERRRFGIGSYFARKSCRSSASNRWHA